MKNILSGLYNAWIIGLKDIQDALKSKYARTNIILMVGFVVFFYWLGTLRPFDKDVSVVVYDQGHTDLAIEKVTLGDGVTYLFREAASLQEMETRMANQNLGLVLPADLDQTLASGGTPTLSGYIFWVDRMKVADLEAKYSAAFTEIIGQGVLVEIGKNIVIPSAGTDGSHSSVPHMMIYFVFWTALALIPYLILEERQTKTLDALLTSPVSPGQIVLGKALAGLFYVLVIGGFFLALNWAFIVNWGAALAAFLGYAIFAVGLALALGVFLKSVQQMRVWSLVVILLLIIPPLFYIEPNLKAGIREVLTWFPSSALDSLLRFSFSKDITPALLWPNLAVVVTSIGIVYGMIVWRMRRVSA